MEQHAQDLFFTRPGLQEARLQAVVADALHGMDDGELFLEYAQSESLVWDDGRLKSASFHTSQGFGMRAVAGETIAYAHASGLEEESIRRAASTVRSAARGEGGTAVLDAPPPRISHALYPASHPLKETPFEDKLAVLQAVDAYLRGKDARVRQVTASLSAAWQAVRVLRGDGPPASDIRPLVRLNISVVVEEGGRKETGSAGAGARAGYAEYLAPARWQAMADEALRQALVNVRSVPAPAGEMPVVIGKGWCGVLLHEAVGHGLEGDFNRKGTSVFSSLMGERVAAKGVTVVDDGTLPGRRGSLSVDDEGTPTQRTVLIEDGILKNYLQDRMNARLMGTRGTGSGRRESYAHAPLPRMTNTFMLPGEATPEDMIRSVKKGLYAVHFGGGQVDITSGKFVFSASEAYLIENGEITRPVKGATLIGSGAEALRRVRMIGNDMALDDGVGTCGKAGQSVPVGVGQPTLLLDAMTVGGTEVAS